MFGLCFSFFFKVKVPEMAPKLNKRRPLCWLINK